MPRGGTAALEKYKGQKFGGGRQIYNMASKQSARKITEGRKKDA